MPPFFFETTFVRWRVSELCNKRLNRKYAEFRYFLQRPIKTIRPDQREAQGNRKALVFVLGNIENLGDGFVFADVFDYGSVRAPSPIK